MNRSGTGSVRQVREPPARGLASHPRAKLSSNCPLDSQRVIQIRLPTHRTRIKVQYFIYKVDFSCIYFSEHLTPRHEEIYLRLQIEKVMIGRQRFSSIKITALMNKSDYIEPVLRIRFILIWIRILFVK